MKITDAEYRKYYEHPTKELRDKLIIANMGLVKKIATRYYNRTRCDKDDLEGYGYEALIKAVEHFDPTKEYQFSTYATKVINNGIIKGVCELRGYKENDKENFTFYHRLSQLKKLAKNDIEDYETLCDIVLEELDLKPELKNKIRIRLALDSKEPTLEQMERTETDEFSDPTYVLAEYDSIKELLNQKVDDLRLAHQMAIQKRYGLQDERPQSSGQIGKEYNIQRTRIDSYEKRGLKKLRKMLGEESIEILEFFDENHVTPSFVQKVKK